MKTLNQLKWWILGICAAIFFWGDGLKPSKDSAVVEIAGGVILLLTILGVIILIGFGVKKALETRKDKSEKTQEKEKTSHETKDEGSNKKDAKKETEGASLAGKIFGGIIALLVVGLTLYFLNSQEWLTLDKAMEHWFLTLLIACALLYAVYACITRTSAAWAGLIILLGVAGTYALIESGGSKHTAQGSNGPTPAVVVQSARSGSEHWQPLEVPGDREWYAIEIPRGKKIKSMKCPADANMMVEGPNVPGGRDALDCAEGKTFNLPEQAFWGATISFQAKYDATLVKVLFVSK